MKGFLIKISFNSISSYRQIKKKIYSASLWRELPEKMVRSCINIFYANLMRTQKKCIRIIVLVVRNHLSFLKHYIIWNYKIVLFLMNKRIIYIYMYNIWLNSNRLVFKRIAIVFIILFPSLFQVPRQRYIKKVLTLLIQLSILKRFAEI